MTTRLERAAAIEARTVVVVALAQDLAAAHDDAAVAVVQRGLGGLLEAEGEVGVGTGRHFVGMVLRFGFVSLSWVGLDWIEVKSSIEESSGRVD